MQHSNNPQGKRIQRTIHLCVCVPVSQVAVHLKHNAVSPHKLTLHKKEKQGRPYCPQAVGARAGVTSPKPERLGSQDWPPSGLREPGTTCRQSSAPWTCRAWSPPDGTTSSRCRQALQKLREAQGTQRLVELLGWRSSLTSLLDVSW